MAQARVSASSKKGKYSADFYDRFDFSLKMMTNSKNWLKDFSQRTPSYQTLGPETYTRWDKAHGEHMDEYIDPYQN